MGSKMLIDASHQEETRVVVLKGTRIEEFDFESAARRQLKGNIYLAKVTRVEPSLQAAFVEYGGNRHGFLAFAEIHPDYYQIPLADRMALLQEEEEDHAREHDEDDNNGHGQRSSKPERHSRREREEQRAEASEDSAKDGGGLEPQDENQSEDQDEAPRAEALDATHAEPSISEAAEAGEDEQESDVSDVETAADQGSSADLEAAAPSPHIEHGVPGELSNGVEDVEEDPENQKVESIGAEDALEEVPQRKRRTQRRQYKIQEVIKRRQVILVQVVKEERGNKGAALTTYLSLAGRYCVLMPNTARGGGISRKITDSGDRRRLKEVAKEIEVPQGMGLIVRTAGAQRTKTEIKRDYDYLLRLWESVRDLTLKSTAPALVYEEGSLVKRAIRDLYTKDVDEVMVEGDAAYREAKDFMKMLMPSHAKNVKPYKDTRPLFSRYQAESQLDGLYSPTVTLPSGGYMVINQTEALVSVDINSGKATREHNIEDTAYKTNLEASDEIARQLRLRDLAGLVVIDFIDMEEKRNNRNVERRLKDALKNDRARIQVGRISHFGLLEMSRQRLRPGFLEGSSRTCPHCEGRGIVRSISSCGLSVLRAIEEHLIAKKAENLTVKCTREIAFYILNEKRDNLLTIETGYGISVFIVPSDELKGSQALIERAPDRNIPPRKVQIAPVRIDSAYTDEDEEEVAEEEVAPEISVVAAEDDDDASDADQDDNGDKPGTNGDKSDGRKRRRRRGRRGGRGREDQAGAPENDGEVPGLGDQPPVEMDIQPDADTIAETPVTAIPPDNEAAADSEQPVIAEETAEAPRKSASRRDRWGRSRERKKSSAESGDAVTVEEPAEMAEPPAEVVQLSVVPPAPAAVLAEPPRKWQPPAPTVQAAPAERKTGWWSKK